MLLPLAWLCQKYFALDQAEYTISYVAFYAAYVINDPHFAVTYLLFYKNIRGRALGPDFSGFQRVRYWVAGLLVPAALIAWSAYAIAARSAPAMGWMIQLMFALVGWHYTKQGFGVLTVLSARRGFLFKPIERHVFLAHSLTGWAYAWASPAEPGRFFEEKGVVYAAWPHGSPLELVTLVIFVATGVAMAAVLLRRLTVEGSLPPPGPLVGFLITVWFWTIFSSLDPLLLYFIPALHSIQYLYFVWILQRNKARESEGPPLFGRPVGVQVGLLALGSLALGWLFFRGGPSFFDSILVPRSVNGVPAFGRLGATPYLAAITTVVNIHHYFMDHVIWRRENPETRFLRA